MRTLITMLKRFKRKSAEYEIRIAPKRGITFPNLFEVWQYRDLLFLFVQREFISKYRQTILGPLWYVLQPLLLSGIFNLVFSNIAQLPTDGVPPILFYLCGLATWGYFGHSFEGAANSLVLNAHLMSKVYFPRLTAPLAAIASKLMMFFIQFGMFILVYFYYKFFTVSGAHLHFTNFVFMVPILFLISICLSLGAGLLMAAATAKYRDLVHMTGFIIQLWMYATPIIFPVSQFPVKWRFLVFLNPMATVVEGVRYAFLGYGYFSDRCFYSAILISVTLLILGLSAFSKTEKSFIDTV